ncbi:MAG: ribonuclease HII [bacterium]
MKNKKRRSRIKNFPNFNEERQLWRKGAKMVVGLDEAGRGPLAGPVVAGAVSVTVNNYNAPHPPLKLRGGEGELFHTIRDSKKLTARQREEWYKILTRHPDIKWGVGIVSHRIIDQINIFEATKLAMKKAIVCLKTEPDYLLLDGNFTIRGLAFGQKAVIRGDEKIFSCAAASIIAKVTRDRIMCRYAKKYPQYGFEKHKGYGTKSHIEAIKKHGPCKIHRRSFRPVKNLKTGKG